MAGLTDQRLRIGIFGGTFDPPHIAHLVLAEEARFQLSLDKVLWLLTPDPPHKIGWTLTPVEQRLAMLESAIADNPCFSVSRLDIMRPAPHYAADTMLLLRQKYPGSNIYYLMGGDSLRDLPTWERPREFLDNCDGLGVMRRPGDEVQLEGLTQLLPEISEKVNFVDGSQMNISAREIRKRIKMGLPFRYFVPGAVFDLIQEWQLYK